MKKLVASLMAIVLAVGLMPAPAFAQETSSLTIANTDVSISTQAKKKLSNAQKKKMFVAYKKVLIQARAGAVSSSGQKLGSEYALFDMGGDGRPELFVRTAEMSYGGGFVVYDYAGGVARDLGVCWLASGWLYGTSKGSLYCASGRQGSYYVDRVVKSSGAISKKGAFTSTAKSLDEWEAALKRVDTWLSGKKAKALQTKPVSSYALLKSKIKVTYEMSEAKVSVTSSKTYTGKAVKPKVTVKVGGSTLKAGKGYAVTYKNAKGKKVSAPKAVGTYKVIVKGKGNLKGSVTKTFKVVKPTKANRSAEARSALKKKLRSLYKEYRDYGAPSNGFTGMRYRFSDLNDDGVVELLVSQDNQWQPMNSIYGFSSGKVVAISSSANSVGEGVFDHRIVSYKKNGVFKVHDWHNHYARDCYYKWNGKTAKLVALREDDAIWSGHSYTYYVNGTKASKAKYNACIKKATKGAKATDFSSETGWRAYK